MKPHHLLIPAFLAATTLLSGCKDTKTNQTPEVVQNPTPNKIEEEEPNPTKINPGASFQSPEDFLKKPWEEFPEPLRKSLTARFGKRKPGQISPWEQKEAREYMAIRMTRSLEIAELSVEKYDEENKGYLTAQQKKRADEDPKIQELKRINNPKNPPTEGNPPRTEEEWIERKKFLEQ